MCKITSLKIIRQTNAVNTASVIFLHGSGDTGPGVLNWIKHLVGDIKFPHIKFIFPTAPLREYTPLDGELSHVWFDRLDISPDVPEHEPTLESIGKEITNLIEKEVDSGISLNRIIIGGFSMGGALALHTAYRFKPGLAGVFTLSSFLNDNSLVYRALKQDKSGIDIPLIMFHGDRDSMVPISWGEKTHETLKELGAKGEFFSVRNTMHELKKKEIEDLFDWISQVVPEE